tara:strand:- start:47388 stop:47870 length:483 start_codon:yes stop_codon:yes gene_type:complete
MVKAAFFQKTRLHSGAIYVLSRLATDVARSSGRSSGVEHNLAKVRVVSSNLIARSIISKGPAGNGGAFLFLLLRFEQPENSTCVKNDPVADPGFGLDKGEAVTRSALSCRSFKPVTDIRRSTEIAIQADRYRRYPVCPPDSRGHQTVGEGSYHAAMQPSA